MAKHNFLIEGVSGTGKSSVCAELKQWGYSVVDGDDELAYQGDPVTGKPTPGHTHENHIWDPDKVDGLLSDKRKLLFFCGGSRNFDKFIHRFDKVFVLRADDKTITERLSRRGASGWGGREDQLKMILRLNKTQEDVPDGINIDATKPLSVVIESIIAHVEQPKKCD